MENKTTEITEQEYYELNNTDIFNELINLRKEIIKTEMNMEKIAKENDEIKRDSGLMAKELLINRLCYANNLTDFEQNVAVYLLDGCKDIKDKFKILLELLNVRRHILDVLGEISLDIEDENEEKGEQGDN